MLLRKRLHNQLVELRGNIRVLCRMRPPIAEDGSGSQAAIVARVDQEDDGILHVHSKGTLKIFELDRVFGPQSSQQEVHKSIFMEEVSSFQGNMGGGKSLSPPAWPGNGASWRYEYSSSKISYC